jgi:peptidoglycan/LPS O-acetylase OafA/YrhL
MDDTFGNVASSRSNNFDAIRLLLATLVVGSHSFPLLLGDNARELFVRITGGQITGGELAVNGFFALSGFLIALSWDRTHNLAQFFKKRLLRIYPGFFVAALFGSCIIAPQIASDASEYWHQFSSVQFLFSATNLDPRLPSVFANMPIPAVNGSLWSIRYEFLCYVGIATLGLVGAFRCRLALLVAFATSIAIYAGQLHHSLQVPGRGFSFVYGDPVLWPRLAAFFLSGVLFYLYRNSIERSRRLFGVASTGLVFFGAASPLLMLPLVLPMFGTYLLFYVASHPVPRLQRFTGRADISYGLYLYAFPVQQLLVHEYGSLLTPLTLFLTAFPLTALLAMGSWFIVEKPFLSKQTACLRKS